MFVHIHHYKANCERWRELLNIQHRKLVHIVVRFHLCFFWSDICVQATYQVILCECLELSVSLPFAMKGSQCKMCGRWCLCSAKFARYTAAHHSWIKLCQKICSSSSTATESSCRCISYCDQSEQNKTQVTFLQKAQATYIFLGNKYNKRSEAMGVQAQTIQADSARQ